MDGLGNPLRFVLTAGQVHDSTQARALVEGLTGAYLLADKAYDSNGHCHVNSVASARPVL